MKYEIIRPILLNRVTVKGRAQQLGLHEKTLAKYLKRFQSEGYTGLEDQRRGPHNDKRWLTPVMQKTTDDFVLPQAHIVVLRLAYHGFSLRELVTIVGQ